MATRVVLDAQLVTRAAFHEPVGAWPAEAVAEDQVEAPTGLVDEVVHVAFVSAVVAAREQHPLLAVKEGPAREVDRLYPREMASPENVAARIVDEQQDELRQVAPEQPGLDRAERGETVGEVVVF